MTRCTIYHNPRCSKSRQTLALLEDKKVNVKVVLYLDQRLPSATLKRLIKKLGIAPKELVRTKEKVFKALNLDLDDNQAVVAALVAHPILIERPIVECGERAVLGRPPENVKELF